MLRPSPNHGTLHLRLSNDDDDYLAIFRIYDIIVGPDHSDHIMVTVVRTSDQQELLL